MRNQGEGPEILFLQQNINNLAELILFVMLGICTLIIIGEIFKSLGVDLFSWIAKTIAKCIETLFSVEETKALQDISKIINISHPIKSESREYVEYLKLLIDWYTMHPQYFKPILFKYEPTFALILATLQDANKKQLDMEKICITINELLLHLNEDVNKLIKLIDHQKALESDTEIQVLINSLNEENKIFLDLKKLHLK